MYAGAVNALLLTGATAATLSDGVPTQMQLPAQMQLHVQL